MPKMVKQEISESTKYTRRFKMNKTNAVLIALLALLIGGLLGAVVFSTNTVETKTVVVTEYQPVAIPFPIVDNTTSEIRSFLLKDKDYEAVAYDLAIAKLEDDDYADLFDFLVDNGIAITDESDIKSYKITDKDASNVDGEDKDADVNFELRVYYENAEGENKRVNLIAYFVVDNGKIKADPEFELA